MATTPFNTSLLPGYTQPFQMPNLNPGYQAATPNPGGQGAPLPQPPPAAGTLSLASALPTPTPATPYPTTPATASTVTSKGYDPNAFTVGKDQTVAGQLHDITASDSPLMQQAATRAKQAVNQSGLLHSSLGVEAGQNAVISQALPIATADAGTFNQAMTNTVNAQNAAKNFEASAGNNASQVNAQLGTNVSLANSDAANKSQSDAYAAGTQFGLAGLDAAVRTQLANLDSQTKMALTTMDNNYKQLLQTNQGASSMFNQTAAAIANISQSTTLDQQGKDDAIATQLNLLNEALKNSAAIASTPAGAVSGLNLSQYFDTGNNTNSLTAGANAATNGSIPDGGSRDANGNVFNADGSPAGWPGPKGMPVGPGQGGAAANPSTPTAPPGTSQQPNVAPGRVFNPPHGDEYDGGDGFWYSTQTGGVSRAIYT